MCCMYHQIVPDQPALLVQSNQGLYVYTFSSNSFIDEKDKFIKKVKFRISALKELKRGILDKKSVFCNSFFYFV